MKMLLRKKINLLSDLAQVKTIYIFEICHMLQHKEYFIKMELEENPKINFDSNEKSLFWNCSGDLGNGYCSNVKSFSVIKTSKLVK